MTFPTVLTASLLVLLLVIMAVAQDRDTGGIKGKVRVETGSAAGVAVIVRLGDQEIARGTTDRNGDFSVRRLRPGIYGLTFRKPGLSVATIDKVEVKPGKMRTLDHIVLPIDEGSIVFIRGSVFDQEGRSFPNARVELAVVQEDGSAKKIDGRVTNETGSFVFRLPPAPAKYRITAKADRHTPASKDLDVESAAVYRIALSLLPPQ
jgi:Carboxypeptidase regulatory-like domain